MKILLLDDHPLIIDFIAEQIIKIDSELYATFKSNREKALLFLNIAQNTTSLSWFLALM
jgi:hypothetical protein